MSVAMKKAETTKDIRTCTTVEMPRIEVLPLLNPGPERIPALDTLRQLARSRRLLQVDRLVSEATRSVAQREAAYESMLQHRISLYRRYSAQQDATIARLESEVAGLRALADKQALAECGGAL